MAVKLTKEAPPCRHRIQGRCSNHFWKVMQESGKPGLEPYLCVLWRARMKAMADYHEAADRVRRFGLTGEEGRRMVSKALNRKPQPEASCPDFRPGVGEAANRCRYFFLETCLLTFPECQERCDDFLPQGDQTG